MTSLEQVWNKGCRGDDLSVEEKKKFAAMARSRFHTFVLGMDHADQQQDEDAALGLVRGLAREINENPGLKAIWMKLSVHDTDAGHQAIRNK
ncbi:MAG: hypothetical protein O3B72_13920, partial [Proteobacteria bacterium]|nr:hypothetical protein [Pseudomonadota bacterium]